mmetsp:Transcript_7028/g.11093  ORF Transcript_7028/g.11093 Transcript_7028/m.11093 type:complete len:126 (+) Transcript_7028:230-607(+)
MNKTRFTMGVDEDLGRMGDMNLSAGAKDEISLLDQRVAGLRNPTAAAGDAKLLQDLLECASGYLDWDINIKAIPLLEDAIKIADRRGSKTDPSTLTEALHALGKAYRKLGQNDDALKVYSRLVSF